MKHRFISTSLIIGTCLTSCITPMNTAQTNPGQQTTQQQPAAGQGQQGGQQQDPLQALLASLANNAVAQTEQNAGASGSLLGNLIASVTGSLTTTQANLVGTWTYTEPSIQFESQNLLTQAGGSTAATKIESYLVSVYKMVGIESGRLSFTFDNNGKVTYVIGRRSQTGTYTFDAANKVVTITNAQGYGIKAYVTISGNNMSLCFDTSKALALFSNAQLSNASSTLGTFSALAQNFNGMKTGFKFTRQ